MIIQLVKHKFIVGSITLTDDAESGICLLENTEILTDQGLVKIQNITKENTIQDNKILGLSKGTLQLFSRIQKRLFSRNVPSKIHI